MYEAWTTKVFHFWSHGAWFSDERMTQVGPVRAKTGTLVGMVIKISILFPFVLELWGYNLKLLVVILPSWRRTCLGIEPSTEEGRARD